MTTHFADRLLDAIRVKNAPVCVGLDPLIERLPPAVLAEAGIGVEDGEVDPNTTRQQAAAAFLTFGRGVIHAIAPHIPAIKINIAFFERYYEEGVRAYFELTREAIGAGLVVIGDVKRADIGHSSTQYALAQLSGGAYADVTTPDAVTVNPYFGFDTMRPFVDTAREQGRGVFVLVQTSNESADQVQGLVLTNGQTLCQRVAEIVEGWATGEGLVGASQYSCIGAVVSPRDIPSTERIRTLMPHCLFLVPGFGAQGRTAEEVARCFKPDGSGALVTASRSVIYAHQTAKHKNDRGDNWIACVDASARDLGGAVRAILPG